MKDVIKSKVTENEKKYLYEVTHYGTRKERFDRQLNDSTYDDTYSVFEYEYENHDIFIIMYRGEYIDYHVSYLVK